MQHDKISGSFRYVARDRRLSATMNLPDEEAIRAFVLTFRFFIQNQEASSFKGLADAYEKLQISDELKMKYSELRRALNGVLDSSSNVKIFNLTRGDIIRTFIYGELAHEDEKKHAMIDSWREDPWTWGLVKLEFSSSLREVLRYIEAVADLNTKVLQEIARKT